MSVVDTTVVLLAGGEGSRFYPLVTNKTMFPFMGRPMIDWVLDEIKRAGYKKVLVAVNEANSEYIKSYKSGLELVPKLQPKPLGQADALKQVLEGEDDRKILVLNAVDMVDASLLRDLGRSTGQDVVVTGMRMKEYFPGGYLTVEGDRVVSIVEKPKPEERPSDWVKLVVDYFASSKMLLDYLERVDGGRDDAYELALDMIMQEKQVGYVEYEKYWRKLKYPHFVLDVMNLLMEEKMEVGVADKAEVSEKADIQGKVRIEAGTRIMAGAAIVGPAYIGKGVLVGQGVLVRGSMIEEGAKLGYGTDVSRSYVGAGCSLHHNFVGDMVLEADVNPSWGTTFANWRLFDEKSVGLKLPDEVVDTGRQKLGAVVAKGVKMGVNCSVMPGVTIAAGSKIYPGSVVTGAVEGDWGFD